MNTVFAVLIPPGSPGGRLGKEMSPCPQRLRPLIRQIALPRSPQERGEWLPDFGGGGAGPSIGLALPDSVIVQPPRTGGRDT
jgi:hypothetical protein